MPLYEHVFLARQDVSGQQVDTMIEQYKTVVGGMGGTIAKVENWGLRPLAYRMNKNRKAFFALLNISAPPAAVAEMERQMRLSEDVLRFITIRVDAHEENPSIMMQKRDRDRERDDRRGERRRDRGPRRDETAGDAPAVESEEA